MKQFIGKSRFVGDNALPEGGLDIELPKIKSKEAKENGNASTKKHHRPIRNGGNAREDLSGYFR